VNGVTKIVGMADIELDLTEAPACPLLGLPFDRRTHYALPDPAHRCFAAEQLLTADLARQATYCLTSRFRECERFRGSQHPDAAGDRSRLAESVEPGIDPAEPAPATSPAVSEQGSTAFTVADLIVADVSPRRLLLRDSAAVLLVCVLAVVAFGLFFARPGGAPAGVVLPVLSPTGSPEAASTAAPSTPPTDTPTLSPSPLLSPSPTLMPSPTPSPSPAPSARPSPSPHPTARPSPTPTARPTTQPTVQPTPPPTPAPTRTPVPTPIVITPPPALESAAPVSTRAP
jgi:hypothetical protein